MRYSTVAYAWTKQRLLGFRRHDGSERSVLAPVPTSSELPALVTPSASPPAASRDQRAMLMRLMFSTSRCFQFLLNPEGIVVEANQASLDLIGDPVGETSTLVVGQPFWTTPWFTQTPGMPEKIEAAFKRAAAGASESFSIGLQLSGARRLFDFSLRPIMDDSGQLLAVVPEATETTSRAKMEETLRQAQKLEAIRQLTGGVAHDFNNLLMVVSGGLNLLERSPDHTRREMLLAKMREAVARGATLTQQLLAFSRRQELKAEKIEVADFLRQMRPLLDRSLGGNVHANFDVPENIFPIHADNNALELAILNLAVNARDAMPADGGTIDISARNAATGEPAQDSVKISVTDSGTGMTPEICSKIFEPFFTTKEIGKGSGLGLAQVHGFAKQSHGQLHVESTPGIGTTMTMVLPRFPEDEPAKANSPSTTFRAKPVKCEAGVVLVVEDDDEVAVLTTEMLQHIGWHVTRVASAEAALTALAYDRPVDMIFSDVMMPGGQNGLELAKLVKSRRPDLPMILTSGYSQAFSSEAQQLGVPMLPKPFNLDTLAAVIDIAHVGVKSPKRL